MQFLAIQNCNRKNNVTIVHLVGYNLAVVMDGWLNYNLTKQSTIPSMKKFGFLENGFGQESPHFF